MAPAPALLELGDSLTEGLLNTMVHIRHEWADEIASGYPEPVKRVIATAIEEAARNTLHGEESVIERIPLADESVLIIATDVEGTDHLEQCGEPIGLAMMEGIVGENNFYWLHNGNTYQTFLRIDPSAIENRLRSLTPA